MTKERRLAIEMWKGIRDMLSTFNIVTGVDIVYYKKMFCNDNGLKWLSNCWFCQYIPCCSECPLHHCSDYHKVVDGRRKDVRVSACNNIIKALGGEA